jgi:phage terminase large subunit-like protein
VSEKFADPQSPRGEKQRLEPFTLPHFKAWAADLMLDDDVPWVLEPFQEAFFADVFGGAAEAWLVVPEANGKTTAVAGLCLYHAAHRSRARVVWAAASRDQAELGFDQAAGIVTANERLSSLFECLPGYRRIRCASNGARIQIFAADERTGDGVIPTLGVLDELGRQRDLRLYRTWVGKSSKRGGQVVAISTAGEPGGEFELTRERIRQEAAHVDREGSFTRATSASIVLHEFAVPATADCDDMVAVKAANPFSGITPETLALKRSSATMTDSHWRRFTCNQPVRGAQAAIDEREWADAVTTDEIPAGEPVWVGLDCAWKWDTTAAVPLWWRDDEFRLLGPASILTPPRDGTSLDPNLVERALILIHERNPIIGLVMDTSKAEQLASWAEAELDCEVIDRGQSNKAAVADFDSFTEALRQGWLHHVNDPGLNRHVLNAIARPLPQGDSRFDRPSQTRQGGDQERRVIDALTAAAMAHCVAAANEADSDDGLEYVLDTRNVA